MAPIKRVSYRTGFVQRLEEVGGMPSTAAYNADTDRVEAAPATQQLHLAGQHEAFAQGLAEAQAPDLPGQGPGQLTGRLQRRKRTQGQQARHFFQPT